MEIVQEKHLTTCKISKHMLHQADINQISPQAAPASGPAIAQTMSTAMKQYVALDQHHHHHYHHHHRQNPINPQHEHASDDRLHQIQSHNQMRTKQYYLNHSYNQQQLKQLASYAFAQQQHQQQQQFRQDQLQFVPGAYENQSSMLNPQQLVVFQGAPRARVASISNAVRSAPTAQVSPRPTSTSPFCTRSAFYAAQTLNHSNAELLGTPSNQSQPGLCSNAIDSTNYLQPELYPQAAYRSPPQPAGPMQTSPLPSGASSASSFGSAPARPQANSPGSTGGSSMSPSDALSLGINLEQYISKRNERERSRVRNVNDAFENLKKSLPLDVERLTKRMSKVEILRTAINYIRNLEQVLGSKQDQEGASARAFEATQQAESAQEVRSNPTRGSAACAAGSGALIAPADSPSRYSAEPTSSSMRLAAPTLAVASSSSASDAGYSSTSGPGQTLDFQRAHESFGTCYTKEQENYGADANESRDSLAADYEMATGEQQQRHLQADWQNLNSKVARTNSFNCSTVYQDERLRNHYGYHYDEQRPFQGSH